MDVYHTSFNVYPFSDTRSSSGIASSSFQTAFPRYSPTLDYVSPPNPVANGPNSAVHRHHSTPSTTDAVWDSLSRLSVQAMTTHPGAVVTFTRTDDGKGFNFNLSGPYHQVLAARGLILRESPIQNRSVIKVTRQEILESNGNGGGAALKQSVIRRLDEIAAITKANISVLKTSPSPPLSLAPGSSSHSHTQSDGTSYSDGVWSSGLEAEKMCELIITGTNESVDVARVRLLVMLDEMSGLQTEPCEIDYKLHAIIAGRKRHVIQSIQEDTATNIYFPPLPLHARDGSVNIVVPQHNGHANGYGEYTPQSQPSSGHPSPPNGLNGLSNAGTPYNPNVIWITGEFFGVQRARDALYQLSMQKMRSKTIISRDIAILPRKLDWLQTQRLDDLKSIQKDQGTYISLPPVGSLTSICTVYGDTRTGIERTVKAVMALAACFYVASFWLLPTQYNMLMPTVNTRVLARIANASGAEVVFKSNCFEMHGLESEVRVAVQSVLELDIVRSFQHEIRFQLELANEHREFISGKKNGKINKIMTTANVKIKFETFNDHNFLIDVAGSDGGAIHGLSLLQEELPAEMSFHVPEAYHKRIIGVGGRSIQRIMKKYGVYVKFNSSEELVASAIDDEDNVLARTPAKNALNLENLKASVMELVNPKDKDYILETISIPRRYHRSLFGEKSIFLRDIESKTNSKIHFPGDGLDIVTIFGPESQVHIAAAMLLDHVPFEADMMVPPHPDLARLCVSQDFIAFTETVKREYEVAIFASIRDDGMSPSSFKFKCQRSNSDCLSTAREMLESFLVSNHVHVYPSANSHKRVDSFTDAFPHFNSKLLSTAMSAESPELSRPAEGLVERRIRLASSTPDVKALFNSPSYVYRVPEQDEHDDGRFSRSSYGTSSSGLNDYWNPPRLHGLPAPGRITDEALKRGSDSRLEAKIKEQSSKPRALTNRAQSLDLTSLSRSGGIDRSGSINTISETPDRVDSPDESSYQPSPPLSAMIPSFPSVYGPTLHTKPRRPLGVVESRDVEDMEGVFAKFKLDSPVH